MGAMGAVIMLGTLLGLLGDVRRPRSPRSRRDFRWRTRPSPYDRIQHSIRGAANKRTLVAVRTADATDVAGSSPGNPRRD